MATQKEQKELDKVPPQNLEAEQSLLGALLLDKEAVNRVIDTLQAGDFYKSAHTKIFEAIADLYVQHEPIDVLSVANRLDERGDLDKVGGRTYLTTLANSVPTTSNATHYAKIVQRKATLRRLIASGNEIASLGYDEEAELDETLDTAEKSLFSVTQKYMGHVFISMKTMLTSAFERIDELHKEGGKLRGIPTGFKDIDNVLAGLHKSDLIILAARPSVGKTSFALDIARNVAVRAKASVGIFSLEMSKEQLVDRILCAEAGVDLWKMRTGKLSDKGEDDDFTKIGRAMDTLNEAQIFIDDGATTNLMEIRARARRLKMDHDLGLLIIDYLQLMDAKEKNYDSRVQEISTISRGLKSLARELEIPILALSQLSRNVEQRSPAIPRLADLRESGAIEQDADIVMFIYRKAADRSLRDVPLEERNIAEVIIDKHRNGPTGKADLYFNEAHASFQNFTRQTDELGPTF